MENYPMYNATANNDYDSYPSVEEYKKIMNKKGQINFAYAGGGDVTGIPMRGQVPIYANNAFNRKWLLGEDYNKTMYNPKVNKEFLVKNGNGSNTYRNMRSNKSYLNQEKDNSYNSYNGYENDLTERNYRRQNSFSDFNRNLSIRNNNLNEIKENENYQKNIKQKIAA
jgi:hypothetical protein